MNNKDIELKKNELDSQMKTAIQQREQNQVEHAPSENSKEDLGKVEMKPVTNVKTKSVGQDELNKMAQQRLGYIPLPKENLPTKGAFYPADMRIEIRSAKTTEIKDFSLMDETNPLDINEKINNMISFCTKISLSDRRGSFKDLVEDDKMYIILSIRELTFPQGESKLSLKNVCTHCDFENSFELKTQNLHYYTENEKITKYYDSVEKVYNVKTKNYGAIRMSPAKIGVAQEITNYARTKQEAKQKWDKAAINILPYLSMDWRGLNDSKIFEKLVDLESWDKNKFSLIYRLTDIIKSAISQKLEFYCDRCGNPIDVDVEIEGGMKSLFIKHDIDDELI